MYLRGWEGSEVTFWVGSQGQQSGLWRPPNGLWLSLVPHRFLEGCQEQQCWWWWGGQGVEGGTCNLTSHVAMGIETCVGDRGVFAHSTMTGTFNSECKLNT